ncbi:MAG: hybrid sensor histidine kinase/response regulator, partial [Nitrospiraceae bacterium]
MHSLKKEPYTLEYRMIAADGRTVWLKDLVTVAAEVDQSTILRGVMVDITAQKNLEEHLRQAQKVEAVGRLAGGIAHDFNNLLTVINGYTELLLNRLDPQDLLYRHISLIKEAGCRTASLTKQLLAFSRKQVLAPVVVDLNQMIAKMEGMVQRLVGEGIQLVLAPGASRSLIKVDPGQLDQVIMNLVVNAADAMPGTGRLSIETANIELDETYIPLTASFKPGPYVMSAVSDTGAGMDKETIAHIFEPFFTTKPSEKGTGLGLSTVYGIVTQSGGDIAVESRPGAGTTFKVFFPRVEEGALTDYKPVTEESDNHLLEGGETILVAEDEPDVRAFVCTVLQQHGYTVLQARHGVEALLLADQHQGLIPLLITDMVMPQMPGTEVAAKMMKTRAGLKVLYISGYSDNPAAHHD